MLFEHENTAAALRQRRRSGKSSDSGTDDDRVESGSLEVMRLQARLGYFIDEGVAGQVIRSRAVTGGGPPATT